MSGNSVQVRVARWSARHSGRAIAVWLLLIAACIAIGQLTSTRELGSTADLTGQSARAAELADRMPGGGLNTENVLVSARSGAVDHAAANQAAADVARRMQTLPVVRHVAEPVVSPMNGAVLVAVQVPKDTDVGPLRAQTAAVQRAYPALRVEETGTNSLNQEINEMVAGDLGSVADISLPVTIVILLLAFGALLAAGVPVLLALSCVGAATGLSALVSHLIPAASTQSAMVLMMGMAVGVDYSLFYVKRVRAERAAGRDSLDAVEVAAETAGHSVLVSGLAVIAAMAGLFVAGLPTFSSLAAGSVLVVGVAVVSSLTVLPAVLVKLGRAIDRPRVPLLWRMSRRTGEPRVWGALLRRVQRRPVLALGLAVAGLLALAAPALGMKLRSATVLTLPDSLAGKATVLRLNDAFPAETSTDTVLVEAPPSEAAQVAARLRRLAHRLDGSGRFVAGTGRVTGSADATVHRLAIDIPYDPESAQARAGVALLRTEVPAALRGVDVTAWAVGGDAAETLDFDHRMSSRLPWVIGFVVLTTMLIVGWVFRSLPLMLVTAGANLLSAGASFGLLVLVFQRHWAEGLLGFHSTGTLINWIPLFTFAILFGLSMDYHVFVLTNVGEAVRQGRSSRDAVRAGILRSAAAVTSAAAVMVSVFALFAAMHLVEMKEIGVGLSVAILIDAVVVRMVLLPAALTLLGDRAWPRTRARPAAPARREPVSVAAG